MTETIPRNSGFKQILDTLKVEKERGITGKTIISLRLPSHHDCAPQVKAQTATLRYTTEYSELGGSSKRAYLLNLIDTPGHVDFTWCVL
jgi:translation elongation factor EF-4